MSGLMPAGTSIRGDAMATSKALNIFDARTPEEWRMWLADHHQSESEVWLVFHKRHTGQASIGYEDAVDEALCFGWIDSLVRRLDDSRYARKFTPRKADSRWSSANRHRYEELKSSGRLTTAGANRPPTDRNGDQPRPSLAKIPAYILEGLGNHPAALTFFESLTPSYRRLYIAWIDAARQQETKLRRLQEAIRLLSRGEKLGLK
jgi:uncharacterized protein YdeI (YjbR/CyaY-like superfamily)